MEISAKAKDVISRGSVKVRLIRSGMFQQLTFDIRRVQHGNINYVELATLRQVDLSELQRIAEEIGLPVESQNGRAFPSGTSMTDFAGL
ncbi:MAG: hypothetical protein M1569_00425 [Candidatus Marsarchaeota archaeon]|nr:hypothetical protein [Candidatus Marsarchaeota archaeon]MCL5412857.1 hypothetical protein [Candidatus Marsarchaeota archaeon]